MLQRILTGLILAAVAGVLIYFGNTAFAVAALICVCFALYEEFKALKTAQHRPIAEPTWAALSVSIPLAIILGHQVVLPILCAASIIIIAGIVFRPEPKLEDALSSLLPLYSVAMPGLAVVSLTQLQPLSVQRVMLLMLIAVPVLGDTFAYFVGSAVGGPKLCPAVSPHKTIAGAVGGLAGAVLAAALIRFLADVFVRSPDTELPTWGFCLAVGAIGGIAGQIGDLFASLVKRHCGIKDFSSIFPGHGGMMDRMDSILFMALVLYCCMLLFYPGTVHARLP
ncbi:MAG: phosphatidate cytidylyltransferase [Clostridia bacterium]|nr:phosphatidate cytidylyltransferase [Clostridia bacterium]